jgi:tetratricopeptide (TPR) repeat protein
MAVVEQLHSPEPAVYLDLLRLMMLTGSLDDVARFARYLDAIDPRLMATEAGRVLAAARAAGALTEADPDYTRIKAIVDERSPGEAAEAADYAAEAPSAANGRPAQNAADLYLALEDFAKAEEMYQLALSKGGVDRDAVLTRLGIAQARLGKSAEAKATFAQVAAGPRGAVAQLWSAYVDSTA